MDTDITLTLFGGDTVLCLHADQELAVTLSRGNAALKVGIQLFHAHFQWIPAFPDHLQSRRRRQAVDHVIHDTAGFFHAVDICLRYLHAVVAQDPCGAQVFFRSVDPQLFKQRIRMGKSFGDIVAKIRPVFRPHGLVADPRFFVAVHGLLTVGNKALHAVGDGKPLSQDGYRHPRQLPQHILRVSEEFLPFQREGAVSGIITTLPQLVFRSLQLVHEIGELRRVHVHAALQHTVADLHGHGKTHFLQLPAGRKPALLHRDLNGSFHTDHARGLRVLCRIFRLTAQVLYGQGQSLVGHGVRCAVRERLHRIA